MIGFHIDMNIAHFKPSYIKKWLIELANLGYDTILWEVENSIKWDTCPECALADAYSKNEFKEILNFSHSLGLQSIPLFQTLAHCEYILKNDKYNHLAEIKGQIDQYCPQNPEALLFLHKFINEYLELFGKINYFHIGMDETYSLGKCDKCKEYVENHSLSSLYVDHVHTIGQILLDKNVTPIIWADFILEHPDSVRLLSKQIMLFDWNYDVHRSSDKIYFKGKGMAKNEPLPLHIIKTFDKFVLPDKRRTQELEPFFTTDYLLANGFKVVTCPSSSSYGDNIFSPRNWLHINNTFDSFQKGLNSNSCGSILTSWTAHLFPYELQIGSIDAPSFIKKYPNKSIEAYKQDFMLNRFGVNDENLFQAFDLLSKNCMFSYVPSLGYDKSARAIPSDYVKTTISKISDEGRLSAELKNCKIRLKEYHQSVDLNDKLRKKVTKGHNYLDIWKLAGQNLINRAEILQFLLENHTNSNGSRTKASKLLKEMRILKKQTKELYAQILKPVRLEQIISWIYGPIEYALKEIANTEVLIN